MPVRAVLFDLDDTLCDTLGCRPERARKALAHVCAEYPDLDPERLLARVLEPLEEPRSVRGLRAALAEHGPADLATVREAERIYLGWHEPLRLFEGVAQTLAELAPNYRLGLISNAAEWYQREKLAVLDLSRFLPHVVFSGSVGHEKPDPRIFHHALALVGVSAGEAVFVGDRLDIDIAGATAAGMRTVWFNHWGGLLVHDGPQPDAVITHFRDLPAALAGLDAHEESPARPQ